ncbi:hypothetical protein OAL70_03575 [Pelagibacteraceae bacterium]|jgi:flagellar basal body-associated protein FliL|nr:hypothetical protein [Pelagibacteraceae bacterium]
MPFLIVLVGLIYYGGGVDILKTKKQETVVETTVSKPEKEIKPIPKKPDPIKEEVKAEIKQPEPVKEEVKAEIKQPEPVKEEVKAEIKQPEPAQEAVKEEPTAEQEQTTTEEIKIEETESNYLKIILYIVGAIAAIFGGFYFFSNKGGAGSQTASSTVDTARRDIEESYQSESQEQQPAKEETPQETQEQQPAKEETPQETQEQQQTTEDDENNNKQ